MMANVPVIVIEDNPSNFLEYRLRGRPSVISYEELNLGHSSLRKIAPYSLKIRQTALIPTQQFFSYAAVVATIDETSVACIIFDLVNADEIIAYAGHFVSQRNFVFDPASREPVISDFSLLDSNLHHIHLSLFGTANPNLVPFPDYFLHRVSEPYQELVTKSQDMLMSTLQQQNKVVSMSNESNQVIYLLREPLTTSFYNETALPISNKSMERITQKIQRMETVKVRFNELGSFHSQTYCQPKAIEDATNFNAVDGYGRTTYYSAYEEPGLMPFYYTSFLLGSLRDRHIVGVIEDDAFFIMATKRVYKRYSPAVPISTESLEGLEVIKKIHLPSTLSLSLVVTMLELRQILRHPFMYPDEIEAITKSFGFDESNEMPAIPSRSFSHQIGPKTMIERLRKTWLTDMLDVHYTKPFQDSVCEYGLTPIDSDNPTLFCLDIARLWIKELLRVIHEDKPPKDDRKLSNFFRMSITEFVKTNLASFGLSPEFSITCHHLGTDGIPSSVCQMSVPAKDIAKHVQMYHTTPLLVCDTFRPFSLSFTSKFVSLTNQTDVSPLEMCKSTVAEYRGIAYLEVLRQVDGLTSSSSPPPTPPPLPCPVMPDCVKKSRKSKKRKRRSVQEKIFYRVMREQRKENSMAALKIQVTAAVDSSPTTLPVSPRLTRSCSRFISRDV